MLKKYKENQIYKFNYGNASNFIFSQIILCIYNFFAFLIVAMPMTLLYTRLENLFKENYILMKIVTILMAALIFLYALMLCVYFFLPKKVIIKNDFIKIKRYMLNFGYILRGFNDEIFIKDIIVCKLYDGYRYRLDRSGPYSVYFFNWDDLVEIKTKDDKSYLVPLKNSEEFVEEVNKRMERLNSHSSTEDGLL